MKCVFGEQALVGGKYVATCSVCKQSISTSKKIPTGIVRECRSTPTQVEPPHSDIDCDYRGGKMGTLLACRCSGDQDVMRCRHPENASGKAVRHKPDIQTAAKAKWDGWSCSQCLIQERCIVKQQESVSPIAIGFLTPGFNLGGAERWILSLCNNFDTSRVIPCFIATRDNGDYNKIMTDRIPRTVDFVHGIEQLRKAVDRHSIDMLVSWGCWSIDKHVEGLGIPVVDVHHGAASTPYMKELARASHRATPYVAAVSDACRMQFDKEAWGRVKLIPNGSDTDRVCARESREVIRNRLGVMQDEVMVLCASRIMPDKNIGTLVKAVQSLPENYRLFLVGPQLHYSQEAHQSWHKMIPGRLDILPAVNHIGDYLAAADVFALASLSEAHPLAVNEAWLAGLPVAMFHLPWVEWLEKTHGQMVYTCNPRNNGKPEILADAIFRAVNDGRYGLVAQTAGITAWNQYTAPAMAARWENYLHETLSSYRLAKRTPQ